MKFPRVAYYFFLIMCISLSLRAVTPRDERSLVDFYKILVKKESLETIRDYIDRNLVADVQDFRGMTALTVAAFSAQPHVVSYVLGKGSKVYQTDCEGKPPIVWLAGSRQVPDEKNAVESIILLLQKNPEDVNAQGLTIASRRGYEKKVLTLLTYVQSYANDVLRRLHDHLLDIATTLGSIKAFLHKELAARTKSNDFERAAQAEVKDIQAHIYLASEYSIESLGAIYSTVICSRLFMADTQERIIALETVNLQNYWQMSPLMIATKGKNKEMFSFLLSKKPEWRFRDLFGNTALSYAAGNELYEGLTLADLTPPYPKNYAKKYNTFGLTPAEVKRQAISLAMVRDMYTFLIPHGENGDPEAIALQNAIAAGFFNVVAALIKYGSYSQKQLQDAESFVDKLLASHKKIAPMLLKAMRHGEQKSNFNKSFARTK